MKSYVAFCVLLELSCLPLVTLQQGRALIEGGRISQHCWATTNNPTLLRGDQVLGDGMEIKPETTVHVPYYRKMAPKRYIRVDGLVDF